MELKGNSRSGSILVQRLVIAIQRGLNASIMAHFLWRVSGMGYLFVIICNIIVLFDLKTNLPLIIYILFLCKLQIANIWI